MKATKWDGQGPLTDCLLRIVWDDDGYAEWVSFEFDGADAEPDGETGAMCGHNDRYINKSSSLSVEEDTYVSGVFEPDASFRVTHWAPLPEVSE